MSGNRGEWYVAGQGLLAVLVLLAPVLLDRAGFPAIVVALGWLIGGTGIATLIAASVTLDRHRSLSPFPKPGDAASLATSGVYSQVRHPIYSGLTLCAVGWSLAWSSIPALIATAALLVFLDIKSRREERWLIERFAEYLEYRARVRRLIPYVY